MEIFIKLLPGFHNEIDGFFLFGMKCFKSTQFAFNHRKGPPRPTASALRRVLFSGKVNKFLRHLPNRTTKEFAAVTRELFIVERFRPTFVNKFSSAYLVFKAIPPKKIACDGSEFVVITSPHLLKRLRP